MHDRDMDDPASESDIERYQAFKPPIKRDIRSSVVLWRWLGLLGI